MNDGNITGNGDKVLGSYCEMANGPAFLLPRRPVEQPGASESAEKSEFFPPSLSSPLLSWDE